MSSMSLTFIHISDKDQLIKAFPQISDLFTQCFKRKLDWDLWRWAYLDNPSGFPCVSVALDNKTIVGHYATIPLMCSNFRGSTFRAALSMSTMVSRKYVRENLFQKLAESVYARLARHGYEFVYGYPNINSKAGFQKRLGWHIDPTMTIAKVTKKQYIQSEAYLNYLDNKSITLDISSDRFRNWRFNKPLSRVKLIDGAYYKIFNDTLDLLHVADHKLFESTNLDLNFNSLLFKTENIVGKSDYFAGRRFLSGSCSASIFHQMSCSDVF